MLRWGIMEGGRGGGWEGNFHHHLLSHQVGSVSCLHLERAVLGPEVNRVGDAGAAPLIDLTAMSAAVWLRRVADWEDQQPDIPSLPPQGRQCWTRGRHTSSSNQRGAETWAENGRTNREALPGLEGWNCGLSRPRGSRKSELASPSFRSCLDPSPTGRKIASANMPPKASLACRHCFEETCWCLWWAWKSLATYELGIETLDFGIFLVRTAIVEVAHLETMYVKTKATKLFRQGALGQQKLV